MATELIAIGNTAANSADIVVTAGAPVTVGMKGGDGWPQLSIDLKDDAGNYHSVGGLDWNRTAVSITAAGTYLRSTRTLSGPTRIFGAWQRVLFAKAMQLFWLRWLKMIDYLIAFSDDVARVEAFPQPEGSPPCWSVLNGIGTAMAVRISSRTGRLLFN